MLYQMALRKAAFIYSNPFLASTNRRESPLLEVSAETVMYEHAVVPPVAYRGRCFIHLSSPPQEPQAPWWLARSLQLKVCPDTIHHQEHLASHSLSSWHLLHFLL